MICIGKSRSYIADRVNLLRALSCDFVREGLDSATSALHVFVLKQHFLQLWIGLADVTEVIVPLVDDRI